MKYRPEIDGLRAIAVVPVILFHAGLTIVSGGFVGVDIFFVISGFLITTILIGELEAGTYSIVDFYERRARRILPALFLVMAGCVLFAWMWMLPSQFEDFSNSLVAVSLFVSNVLFWKESDYFAPNSEYKPLLHTWSLAVEEQYYLFFPIFLLIGWRFFRNRLFWLLVVLALSSLLLADFGSRKYPSANFFLAPPRIWELFAGSIAAFVAQAKGVRSSEALSLLGMAGIALSLILIDETIPFPSLYTLVPVTSVVLILLYGSGQTFAGRFLSNRVFVGVGLISYSAYLWHQPLFAFARIRSQGEPGLTWMLVLALSSIGLAYLSWRYVEAPFRNRKGPISRAGIFIFSGIGMALFIAIGIVGANSTAKLDALTPGQRAIYDYTQTDAPALYGKRHCFLRGAETAKDFGPGCMGAGRTLIWGDSHAAALALGLTRLDPGIGYLSSAACPALIGRDRASRPQCAPTNTFVMAVIARNPPRQVIIAAHWSLYRNKALPRQLRETIRQLRRAGVEDVVVMGSMPEFVPSLPEVLLRSGRSLDGRATAPSSSVQTARDDELLRPVARQEGARFISLRKLLCKKEACDAVVPYGKGFVPLIWDSSHLTEGGSQYLADMLVAEGGLRLPVEEGL